MSDLSKSVDKLVSQLRAAESRMDDKVEAAVFAGQIMVATDAARGAPVDTGRLRNSIVADDVEVVDFQYIGIVGTNLSYAKKMEEKHPSRSGYMRRGLAKNEARIIRRIKKAVEESF